MSAKATMITVVKKLAGLQTGATACCGGGATLTVSATASDDPKPEGVQGRGTGCCSTGAATSDPEVTGAPAGASAEPVSADPTIR